MDIILKVLFLSFGNINIQFAEKKLTSRFYITEQVLPITEKIELIDRKKFAKAALNQNIRAFIVHVALFISKMTIILIHKA